MSLDIAALFHAHEEDRYDLHIRHLNEQMVHVLKVIGYDVSFRRAQGAHLWDRDNRRYLDLLSGWGVFALGRNHKGVRDALVSAIDGELPNLVQMDVSPLAGLLAARLLSRTPYLDKAFFANSGSEAVETAIKFARSATGRPGILFASHAFHGLTYGSLSITGEEVFRRGFGPLLQDCIEIPFDDLAVLERALASKTIAAFIVEPIQGKGVNVPSDGYLEGAAKLCRHYGALFVVDEIQTGLGRTGKFLAIEHWGVEPDMVLLAKSLSGGYVPVGAVLTRRWIFDKIFDRLDRAVVHGSTFSKNDLAMATGLATLHALAEERLIENAAEKGAQLIATFKGMAERYEFVKKVHGKGLMIGIEFGPPRSLKLKAAWSALETMNKGLFCQLVTVPLFKEHRVLCQVAGHGSHVVKLLPPLVIDDEDCTWIEHAFDAVIADSHRVPGAAWSLGKTLAGHAMKAKAGVA